MVKTINSKSADAATTQIEATAATQEEVMSSIDLANESQYAEQTEQAQTEVDWELLDRLYSGVQPAYREATGEWASSGARAFVAAKHLFDQTVGIDMRVLAKYKLPQGTPDDRRTFIRDLMLECGVSQIVVSKGAKVCMHLTAFQMEMLSSHMRGLYGQELTEARAASKAAREAQATQAQ